MMRNEFEIKLVIEPNDQYKKALHALIEADKEIQPLTPLQKQQLIQEYLKIKSTKELYNMFNLHNGLR